MANEKRLINPETIKLELAFIGCEPKHLAAVERCATVDAVEVVHGEWILERTPDGKPYCFHCSVCDDDFHYIGVTTAYRYYPNCGAKMDGDGNG